MKARVIKSSEIDNDNWEAEHYIKIGETGMPPCEGCLKAQKELANEGTFYEFISDAGWTPLRMIIDNDTLRQILLSAPRKPIIIPHDTPALHEMVKSHEIVPEHIDHVDAEKPIFLGDYIFTGPDGEAVTFQLCPDGHHRIAQLLRDCKDVACYWFTEREMLLAAHYSPALYLRSKGVFIAASDAEVEELFWPRE